MRAPEGASLGYETVLAVYCHTSQGGQGLTAAQDGSSWQKSGKTGNLPDREILGTWCPSHHVTISIR